VFDSLFFYIVTKGYTFDNMEQWIEGNEKCEIGLKVLLGNRNDPNSDFDKEKAKELA
jgi:hypothetical protein